MDPVAPTSATAREDALARVLEYRQRGRRKPRAVRAVLAVLGALLLLVAIPLTVVATEFGVPAMLVALRLLAVEVDWAAKAYAWLDWRFTQARDWFHRRSRLVRGAILLALLALAAALVWLVIHEVA